MSTFRQRKDGGYFIRKPGDTHPINTFQLTDEGAGIVRSSGCQLGESFPDQLFYLLHDLGHLSTKDDDSENTSIGEIRNLDWAVKELSREDRVEVAAQIAETHGVGQLLEGDAAEWTLNLTGEPPAVLEPLVRTIVEETGYSYETVRKYNDDRWPPEKLLETAICAYLQMEGLRSKEFERSDSATGSNEVLGADGDYIYIELGETPRQAYDIVGEVPETVPEDLKWKINEVLGESIGVAAFAILSRIEVWSKYDVDDGMVIPRERLDNFPVEVPPRSELTEQYEAFRLLQNHIQRILESPETDREHGDGSPSELWYRRVHEQLIADGAVPSLGTQQHNRVDHSAQLYRDCFGNGDKVTEFSCIEMTVPNESEQLELYEFGPFDYGEEVEVPIAPESGDPVPVYPQSQQELDYALALLDEFPKKPDATISSG